MTPQVWGHDVTAWLHDDDGGRPGIHRQQTRLQNWLQTNIRSGSSVIISFCILKANPQKNLYIHV